MLVPVTYAQPAAAPAVPLIPIEITAGGASPGAAPGASASGAAQFGLATPTPTPTAIVVRHADLNVLANRPSTVSGALHSGAGGAGRSGAGESGGAGGGGLAGRSIALQALGPRGWHTIAGAHTGARGQFRLTYTSRRTGSEPVRLRFAGDVTDLGAHRALGELNVYRLAMASWYGGGGSLACGGELTGATLGVANRTLPCGTLVTLRYGDRTIQVPVVDRGPYVAGREFDLTEATAQTLGFAGVGEVWSTR